MTLVGLSSRVTRKSRSNFYYAFLALPRARREALYAVYAFCRIVDDIADLGTDAAAQRVGLAAWRRDIGRCYDDGAQPEHPIARQLAAAVRRFSLPRGALEAIVDGCEMDLQRTLSRHPLPHGAIHGDLFRDNALFTGHTPISDYIRPAVHSYPGTAFVIAVVIGILLGHFLWGPATGRTSPSVSQPQ